MALVRLWHALPFVVILPVVLAQMTGWRMMKTMRLRKQHPSAEVVSVPSIFGLVSMPRRSGP